VKDLNSKRGGGGAYYLSERGEKRIGKTTNIKEGESL